jgi:hypothetical protein
MFCTIICSYNTPEMTDRVVKELLRGKKHDIYVLDNSSNEEQVYKNDKVEVIDLGRENVGFGGMHDYIFTEPRFRKYDFVGIFNNDIYDIPENYFETIEKNIDGSEGIVSSAIKKDGSGWEQMWKIHQDGKRQVFHVEDIACYFNTKLFDRFAEFIPFQWYGITDIQTSQLALQAGYKLYIIDDIEIGHELGGARKKVGSYKNYLNDSGNKMNEWFDRFPELKKLYADYLKQISRKVCVVIPNYNHNDLLRNSIESVLNNKTKCDIIVVDDYSDIDPYEDIKDLPIRFLKHDRNRGLAQARNTAIASTKAEYILPLDADDELYPNVIDKMLEQVGDVIYGNLVWKDNDIQLKPTVEVRLDKFLDNNQIFGCSLYKRDLWKKIGGYWEKYKEFYEDWDFWARCAKVGAKFKYIDLDIYKYGGTTGGMCDRLGKNREENVKIVREHICS